MRLRQVGTQALKGVPACVGGAVTTGPIVTVLHRAAESLDIAGRGYNSAFTPRASPVDTASRLPVSALSGGNRRDHRPGPSDRPQRG